MRFAVAALMAVGTTAASAADLGPRAYTKAPTVEHGLSWSGWYIGLNAGGASSQADLGTSTIFDPAHGAGYFGSATDTALFNAAGAQRNKPNGFTGGVQAGFNWQAGNFLAGIESDFQSFKQAGGNSTTAFYTNPGIAGTPFTIAQSFSTDWLWTLRPRVGLTAGNWLFYGTGGVALTNLKANWLFIDRFADTEAASLSKTKTGWAVGAGVEYALTSGWSIKAEYLHLDFGSQQITTTNLLDGGTFPVPGQPFSHSVKLTSDIARAGVNYSLGGGM